MILTAAEAPTATPIVASELNIGFSAVSVFKLVSKCAEGAEDDKVDEVDEGNKGEIVVMSGSMYLSSKVIFEGCVTFNIITSRVMEFSKSLPNTTNNKLLFIVTAKSLNKVMYK